MRNRRFVAVGAIVGVVMAMGQPAVMAAAQAAPVTSGPGQAALTAGQARSLSTDVTQPVIVVLKNQVSNLPDTGATEAGRSAEIASAQQATVNELHATAARNLHQYRLINAISATVSPGEAARLAANPAVSQVVPDEPIKMPNPVSSALDAANSVGRAVIPPDNACLPNGKVQLNPQADEAVNAVSQTPGAKTANGLGYTGAGVKVGFIADGLNINDTDFIRPDGQHVFVDYKDFSGSGTGSPTAGGEAFLDAGSIAAQGRLVYNVAHYSDLPDAEPCNIKIEGVSPGVSLVGLDVFGGQAFVYNSVLMEAIDYAVSTAHVNVLNESIGSTPFPDKASLDLAQLADDAAVAAGVTVTVSSGDNGVTNTINSPGSDPNVISAGASTTYRADAQTGYGGARFPGITGWLDNNISSLTSAGQTEAGRTIDLVAPGELNWLPCSTDNKMYIDCTSYAGNPAAEELTGGTSEAAPVTAGVAALVIQAYRQAHGGATPSPAVVKQILTSTATPINAPGDQEGAGLVNAYQAVLAARSYAVAHKARGARLITSPSQLDFRGPPAGSQHGAVTVTNNGSAPETVAASTRQIGPYTSIASDHVTLSNTASSHTIDWQGYTDNVEKVTFTVPPGQDRLNAAISFKNASLTNLDARVRLTLVDARGRLAAYSLPQGNGNYGDVQVAAPVAGTWTAYIYSRNTAGQGTTGPVVFGASVATWIPLGTVSPPTMSLAPGQSGTFTLSASDPSAPGDEAGAVLLDTTAAGTAPVQSSVPVVLRSTIPTGATSFTGTLTGGNGRSVYTGQAAYYQIDLPAGVPELNASITVASPNDDFSAMLVNPQGAEVAVDSNQLLSSSPSGPVPVPQSGAQLHALAPMAGTWDLVIDFAPTVSGTTIASPYTVATDQTPVTAEATGVPDSASTALPAGTPVQASVSVKNTGNAPEQYFVDPRLNTTSTLDLAPVGGNAATVTPGSPGVDYIVPPETSTITWSAKAPIPILDEATYFNGDPDLVGSVTGTTASGDLSAQHIADGPFANIPEFLGPDGVKGTKVVPVTTGMTATTANFDPTVTSATGDLWASATNAKNTYNVITVQPGQTAQIPVTFTPRGPTGSTVTGTLYIDDAYLDSFGVAEVPQGNQIAAVPYTYKVG